MKKLLVIGIIALFICMGIQPAISNEIPISTKSDIETHTSEGKPDLKIVKVTPSIDWGIGTLKIYVINQGDAPITGTGRWHSIRYICKSAYTNKIIHSIEMKTNLNLGDHEVGEIKIYEIYRDLGPIGLCRYFFEVDYLNTYNETNETNNKLYAYYLSSNSPDRGPYQLTPFQIWKTGNEPFKQDISDEPVIQSYQLIKNLPSENPVNQDTSDSEEDCFECQSNGKTHLAEKLLNRLEKDEVLSEMIDSDNPTFERPICELIMKYFNYYNDIFEYYYELARQYPSNKYYERMIFIYEMVCFQIYFFWILFGCLEVPEN